MAYFVLFGTIIIFIILYYLINITRYKLKESNGVISYIWLNHNKTLLMATICVSFVFYISVCKLLFGVVNDNSRVHLYYYQQLRDGSIRINILDSLYRSSEIIYSSDDNVVRNINNTNLCESEHYTPGLLKTKSYYVYVDKKTKIKLK